MLQDGGGLCFARAPRGLPRLLLIVRGRRSQWVCLGHGAHLDRSCCGKRHEGLPFWQEKRRLLEFDCCFDLSVSVRNLDERHALNTGNQKGLTYQDREQSRLLCWDTLVALFLAVVDDVFSGLRPRQVYACRIPVQHALIHHPLILAQSRKSIQQIGRDMRSNRETAVVLWSTSVLSLDHRCKDLPHHGLRDQPLRASASSDNLEHRPDQFRRSFVQPLHVHPSDNVQCERCGQWSGANGDVLLAPGHIDAFLLFDGRPIGQSFKFGRPFGACRVGHCHRLK